MTEIYEDPELRLSGFAVLELDLPSAPSEIEFVMLFLDYGLSLAENGEKTVTPHVFRAPLIDFKDGKARYSFGPNICYFINDFDLVEIAAPDKAFSTGEVCWPRIGLGDWRPGKPVPTREEALQAYLARRGKKPRAARAKVKEVPETPTQKPEPAPEPPPPPEPSKVQEVPKKKIGAIRYRHIPIAVAAVIAIIGGTSWLFRHELGVLLMELVSVSEVTPGCESSKLLFVDKFDGPNAHWITHVANNDISPKFLDGRMVVDIPGSDSIWLVNEENRYDDADICVKVKTVRDPAGANVGLAFWYSDLKNAHYFLVYPFSKQAVVFGGSDKNEWFRSDAIKSYAGAVN